MGDLVPMQIKHFQIREPAQDFFLGDGKIAVVIWRQKNIKDDTRAKIRFGYVLLECFTMSPLFNYEIVIC